MRSPDAGVTAGSVARRTALVTAGSVGVQALTLVSYVVLARLAAPEVFGTFAAASILVTMGTVFVESGMTAAVVRRVDRLEEAAATALVATLAGGVLLTALSAALAPVVGLFFDSTEIALLALAVSGVHVLNASAVAPDAILQRRLSVARGTVVESAWIVSYALVAGVGLSAGLEAWAFVLALYLGSMIRVALIWGIARWRPRLGLASFALWRELASYGRHVLAGELVRHSGGILNTAVIGRVLGFNDLAQFNYGNRVATQSAAPFAMGIGSIVFPALTSVSHAPDVFARGFLRALRATAFVVLPLSFAFLAIGERFAVLAFGDPWRPSGRVLASLCLLPAALALISLALETFKAAGRPQMLPRIHLPTALVPIGALAIGAGLGLVVIGALTSVGLAVVGLRAIVLAGREARTARRAVVTVLAPPAMVAALAATCVLTADHAFVDGHDAGLGGWTVLLGEAAAFALLYLGAMRLVAPVATRDALALVRQLRRRRGGMPRDEVRRS